MFGLLHYRPMSLGMMLRHNLPHIRDMAIGEFLSYLIFGLMLFGFLFWLRRAGQFRLRIRRSTSDRPAQIGREALNSTRAILIYNGIQIVTRVVALGFGYILTFDHPLPIWEVALSFVLVMIGHDAYFYWVHRLMHLPAIFRLVHWEHHRSTAPTVFTAYSFSISEAFLQGLYPIIYVALFPCVFWTLIFFQFVEIVHDVAIHAGVDIFPRFLVTHRRFGWLCGAVYHDMHHAVGRTNYGLYTRFWDRLMKTEHPQFVALYNYVHSPENDGNAYKLLGRVSRPEAPVPDAVLEPTIAG